VPQLMQSKAGQAPVVEAEKAVVEPAANGVVAAHANGQSAPASV
jgi:hypothetical protein